MAGLGNGGGFGVGEGEFLGRARQFRWSRLVVFKAEGRDEVAKKFSFATP